MSRVQIEIMLGIILVLVTSSILIYVGVNEEERMTNFTLQQRAHAIEVGAELYDINCKNCHGIKGEGIPGVCPPLNDRNFFDNRVKEVGWSGSQEDYIISTVSAGRLVSTRPDQYNGFGKPVMPAWSEKYGGPLRDDQIKNIAAFIMNWEASAGEAAPPVAVEGVGTDITVQLPEGNAQTGETLANTKGCAACHITAPVGPAWAATADQPGIGARAETRFQESGYTGAATTAEQYLLESIVNPNAYVVPPFAAGLMPANYAETLSAQEVADLIAYMLSLK